MVNTAVRLWTSQPTKRSIALSPLVPTEIGIRCECGAGLQKRIVRTRSVVRGESTTIYASSKLNRAGRRAARYDSGLKAHRYNQPARKRPAPHRIAPGQVACSRSRCGNLTTLHLPLVNPHSQSLAEQPPLPHNHARYDQFNRLVGAIKNNGAAVFSYVYDRFGNRWQQNGPNSMQLTFTGNNPGNPQNNNRIDGYSYDAAGNLLNDGVHSYAYNAENRITSVDAGSTATYLYDARNHAVTKTIFATDSQGEFAGSWDFLYDQSDRLITETAGNGSGALWRSEVFAGSRHLETSWDGNQYIDHADHLGTERARFDTNYSSWSTSTSLPFGDALQWNTSYGISQSAINFTGKERDAESGLDNFGERYFTSSMGRFMRPDPSNVNPDIVDTENPQALNMYSYVLNNPLNAVDPDGLDYYLLGGDQCGEKVQCDDKGHVLDSNGKAVVITDEQIANSNGLAKIDENGNLQI